MYLICLILFPIKMSVICTLVTLLYLTFVMTLFQTILYLYYSIKLLINDIYSGNAPFLYFLNIKSTTKTTRNYYIFLKKIKFDSSVSSYFKLKILKI